MVANRRSFIINLMSRDPRRKTITHMAQFTNSFVVSGIIVKDANIRKFDNASVARFGISIMTKNERAERGYDSSIMNCEAWRKPENEWSLDMLKKGAQLTISGYFKSIEWNDKDTNEHRNSVVLCVTKIEKTEKAQAPVTEQIKEAAAEVKAQQQVCENCECAGECAPVDDLPF